MVSRFPGALAALFVLAGASAFAIAQMEVGDTRVLPYQGRLEVAGVPAASGAYTLRFGLFPTANADDSCLLTNAETCSVWGEERTVDVVAGNFSVVLGESVGIADTVLNGSALFLGIAVSGPEDAGVFSLLNGKQEILPVPFAARAAAAKNYNVVGTLTAQVVNATTLTTGSIVADTVESDSVVANSVDSVSLSSGLATLNAVRLGGNANKVDVTQLGNGGLDIRTTGSVGANNAVLRARSSTGEVFRVNQNGDATFAGNVTHECGAGWTRIGAGCIENAVSGPATTLDDAMTTCDSRRANVCSIGELMLCDIVEPSSSTCTTLTDSDAPLWTRNIQGNDANAFARVIVYNGSGNDSTNEVDVTSTLTVTNFQDSTLRYYCCR